jgi:acetyltransferase-like isoleucine patch superfamily enzyme
MTEGTRIMVRKSIHIGEDFVCAWNVFITDCDWHETEGQCIQEGVYIGNHVWVAPNASILKGTKLGEGCIVATGAVLHKIVVPDHCVVGGIPGRVLARDRRWHRDMKLPDVFNSEFRARSL